MLQFSFPVLLIDYSVTVQFTLQGNQFTSLGKETCKLSVFEGGEMVEFRADCDICDCGLQCDQCNGDDAAPDGEGKPMKL